MQALVKYDNRPDCLEMREMPVPEIAPDEVLLRVEAVGICGSDLEMWHHTVSFDVDPPVILGHEFSGTAVKVGTHVARIRSGDRLVSETAAYVCGRCPACRTGNYNQCPERRGFGFRAHGACAPYVAVREGALHTVPAHVDLAEAALTEPLCVAYNALAVKSTIRPGDVVAVIGPGPIGLMAVQIARVCGASAIVLAGTRRSRRRLEVGREVGATHTAVLPDDDLPGLIRNVTRGLGVDLVVDAAGPAPALKMAMEIVRRNGQITKVAWDPEPLGLSLDPLLARSITLQGVFSHTWDTWEHVLRLEAAGMVRLRELVTHRFPLHQWREAYEALESGEAVKALLIPA